MMLSLMLAAAGAVYQGQYTQPLDVPQHVRLELTPVLDGTIQKEEWDAFSNQTFLQWEPGKLYIAGQMAAGKDLVLSIDGKGDGWLVGRDNIEFRVSVKDGKPVVSVRELDATAVKGPIWRDRHDLEAASMAAVSTAGDTTSIEAVFDDAGLNVLPRTPKNVKLRLDVVDANADAAPFLPRTCMDVRFDDRRAVALPRGMEAGFEAKTRSVIPGESIGLRFTFNGSNSLGAKSIEMRSLGDAEGAANRMSVVFPNFDTKGRAFVDYVTKIDSSAVIGYRIVRGRLQFKDGPEGITEASYRIAPTVDFRTETTEFDRLPEKNTVRVPYILQSYAQHTVDGLIHAVLPTGWVLNRGEGQKFKLFGNGLREYELEIHIPADTHGTFPIKFTAEMKNQSVNQVCYLTIR